MFQPDLFTVADDMDCSTCPQAKRQDRCHGSWFPDSPYWKSTYCTRTFFDQRRFALARSGVLLLQGQSL